MVEPQIVVLVVAGSSPVGHPAQAIDLAIESFRAVQTSQRHRRYTGALLPQLVVENYKIAIDAILQTCNLGRHVHKSQRYMATFRAITFTQ